MQERLKQQLSRLHDELASGEDLDAETRELLERVSADIERVLHEDEIESGSITARVEAAALEFEARHPRLSRFMSEITDTLAKIGV